MTTPTLPKDLDVWILAGQSNMEGGGMLRDGLATDERVWSFTPAGVWELAAEPLHRPWESFTENHPARLRIGNEEAFGRSNEEMARIARQTQVTGAGLGLPFAIKLAEKAGRPVGLIPCAHGGTTLEDWSASKRTTSDLYGGMLERIHRAGGQLRGLLWYQGEADTTSPEAATYGERFAAWMQALRQDLQAPELPVFLAQLGRLIEDPLPDPGKMHSVEGWETMREALRKLPDHVPYCQVTSAIDLGLHDAIHLDGPSLIRLGERLAHLASGEESPTISSIVRDREEEQIRGGCGVIQICCDTHGSTWKKCRPLSGFSVLGGAGRPHPTVVLIQAEVASNDPKALRLITNVLPDETVRIGYGLGLNPFCNVVTERDLPLAAFAARALA